MRINDIENWALHIIERVESKQPVEDSRVELKSEWPKDRNKAARQIAGHANAARGEPILWLLGVDEKKGVTGVNYEEISNWKQSVEAEFDGLPPSLTHINIPYKSRTVAALLWETERRPFLVKNSKGGHISLEVPWRDAGSTRTANRAELLKILSPVSRSPSFEVIKGRLDISTGEFDSAGRLVCTGGLFLDVYIVPRSDDRVTIPYHKCEARLRFINSGLVLDVGSVWFESGIRFVGMTPPSSTIDCTTSEIIITGPGMATIKTTNPSVFSEQKKLASGDIQVEVKMHPVGSETPVSIVSNLEQTKTPKCALGQWIVKTTKAKEKNDHNLTKGEIDYLLKIADREGKIYEKLLSAFSGRDTETYREMLNKFVQIGLMREELDYWSLTSKGYDVCEELRQNSRPKNDKIDTPDTPD